MGSVQKSVQKTEGVPAAPASGAPIADFISGDLGKRTGGADLNLLHFIPGYDGDYFGKFWDAARSNDFSMDSAGVFGKGLDLLHSSVPKWVNGTKPYRSAEVALQLSADVAALEYFQRPSLYGLQISLAAGQGPDSVGPLPKQSHVPQDAAGLSRMSANGAADEAAAYASNLAASHASYHDAAGLLASRLVGAIRTDGWSLLSAAASPDTYLAAYALGQYIVNGKTDARNPQVSAGPLRFSLPTLDFYRTPDGPFVIGRVFIDPGAKIVPMLSVGAGGPGVRAGAALAHIPIWNGRLYATPVSFIDVTKAGIGFWAGASFDLRVFDQFGLTAAVNYSVRDVVEETVRAQTNGLDVGIGVRYGFFAP